MLRYLLTRVVVKNKELIFREARHMQGFLRLTFKERNTDSKWTKEEKERMKGYLRRLSAYVPVVVLFILPGGSIMLPILVEILDRRKQIRGRS